jgi:hypothetical protein
MSVDREYKIKVSLVSEGSGAAQAADDLKKVGKAGEEAGEGVKFFEFHGKEFSKLLHELDGILPGIGLLIKAAFNPATLGIGATVFLVERIKDALTEYNQKLDEIGEAAAKADFASGIEAAVEATRDANAEQAKYLANLHEIEKGEQGVAAQLNNQLQLMAAIEAARQQKAEADKTLALARLKEQEVMGGINPTQAAMARQLIEDQYIRDKRAADERKFQAEQDARLDAAEKANERQEQLNKRQVATADALTKAKAKRDQDLKDNPTEEKIKAAEKAQEEAQKAAEHQQREHDRFPLNDIIAQRNIAAQGTLAAATADLQQLYRLRRNAEEAKKRDLSPLEIAADQAKKEAQANDEARTKNRDAANSAQRQHDATKSYEADSDKSAIGKNAYDMHSEIMQRGRALEKEFQDKGAGMNRADMKELLNIMRMMGEKVFEQGENAITRQEFNQQLQAIRKLIEKKGK